MICTGGFSWNDKTAAGLGQKDVVFQNIDFFGPYDSTNNTGSAFDFISTFDNPPNLLLFDGCTLDGFSHAIYNDTGSSSDVEHRVTILNDTVITNFQYWGYAESSKTASAIVGSRLMSHVDALIDSTPNQGSPFRTGGNNRLTIVSNSDFFVRQGWSSHGNYNATQPCARLNSEGFEGAKINCQASAFEGGYHVISLGRAGGSRAHAGNAIIEKNYILGSYQTPVLVNSVMGGMTLRNNVMLMPDTGRLVSTNDPFAFVELDNPDGNATNRASPIAIYNNTLVNRCSAANYTWHSADPMANVAGTSAFSAVSIGNNVIHQPSIDTPVTGDAPLATSPILWPPREKGYHSTTVPLQSQCATPPDTVATYAPLVGSDALGDAQNDPVAYDDFYGNQRPQYPSRGALEMA